MGRIFEKQAGRNVEVYVDDILIKSRKKSCFISDLDETFSTLKGYEVKLNPVNCSFWGQEQKVYRVYGNQKRY